MAITRPAVSSTTLSDASQVRARIPEANTTTRSRQERAIVSAVVFNSGRRAGNPAADRRQMLGNLRSVKQGETAQHQIREGAGHGQAAIVGSRVETDRLYARGARQPPLRIADDGQVPDRGKELLIRLHHRCAFRAVSGARERDQPAALGEAGHSEFHLGRR